MFILLGCIGGFSLLWKLIGELMVMWLGWCWWLWLVVMVSVVVSVLCIVVLCLWVCCCSCFSCVLFSFWCSRWVCCVFSGIGLFGLIWFGWWWLISVLFWVVCLVRCVVFLLLVKWCGCRFFVGGRVLVV